jgi:hypothetical protein
MPVYKPTPGKPNKKLHSKVFSVPLYALSFWYLGIPVLIFLASWLSWYVAVPACLAWAVAMWGVHKETCRSPDNQVVFSGWELMVVGVGAALFCLFAGVGGVTYQHGDYDKHNAIFHDLIQHEWPVIYPPNAYTEATTFLNYYLGYYLVPSVLAKLTGMEWAALWVFLWTSLGTMLALMHMKAFARMHYGLLVLGFLLFGGFDVLTGVYRSAQVWYHEGLGPDLLEVLVIETWEVSLMKNWGLVSNARNVSYVANIIAFESVPQHALASWLAVGVLMGTLLHRVYKGGFWLLLAFVGFWSPLVAVGILPWILFVHFSRPFSLKEFVTLPNMLAVPLGILLMLYFLCRFPLQPSGWAWHFIPADSFLILYVLFIALEFGVYAAIAFWVLKTPRHRYMLVLVCMVLLVSPLYKLGYYSDLLTRGSNPSLCILYFLLVWALPQINLLQWSAYSNKQRILVFCLLLGFANPVRYIAMRLIPYPIVATYLPPKVPTIQTVESLYALPFRQVVAQQYMGDMEGFFYRYLAKK